MKDTAHKAVAIVGVGAVLPDAPNAPAFWENVKNGRYSISEVSPERWNADDYFDADPKAPDKTYTKIGGWCRDWEWDPLAWKMPIPPKVSDSMDLTQKWAIICARQALADYGYPERKLDPERTAVILGNAMGGDMHLFSAARILFPEVAGELEKVPEFAALPPETRKAIVEKTRDGVGRRLPPITEDTMPGELANIVAGRVAALFDFHGPNYIADAACASTMAAMQAAVEGLEDRDYDAVLTGGVDANMAPSIFVKFCKIGALSATGSRPYADGADGFVMGEGGAFFVLKRLQDAERDGDRVYAVIRGLGGSSDGRGKGITAPNPVGQKLAVQRAWHNAGVRPSPGDLIEGHGTSTRVGDVAEVESVAEAFAEYNLPPGSLALGSVKSNIGHLKGAAGAAGILKAVYALHEKVLPPSINFDKPNPNIDFEGSPFRVNTELKPWDPNPDDVRRVGVSAFGFGGTNFHAVLEEYVPGRLAREQKSRSAAVSSPNPAPLMEAAKTPHRGALVIGADTEREVLERLATVMSDAAAGTAPPVEAPLESDLRAAVRVAIDYGNAEELAKRAEMAIKALEEDDAGRWKALRAKGVHVGRGPAPKVAFLFTGQGSQYVNMLRDLKDIEPVVADAYDEADAVMQPLLNRRLTDYIFVDDSKEDVVAAATDALKQTEITQPAVLATETALARLLGAYGVTPDMVMGHSLGEYGALVASGAMPFDDGLRAVSARGGAMTQAAGEDNGLMAAAWGPIAEIQKILEGVDGYVVVANINSTKEAVIGGATEAVQKAIDAIREAGFTVTQLTVSHAFHTEIVAAAADNLGEILSDSNLKSPDIPIVANISGEFYPMGPGVKDEMVDILSRQVASPVQFVKGLDTLYDTGARLFIELGPKRALYGFADDVVGGREGVVTLFTNHPRIGDVESFNQALCGLYAAGLGVGRRPAVEEPAAMPASVEIREETAAVAAAPQRPRGPVTAQTYEQLGRMFADVLDRGYEVYGGRRETAPSTKGVCITGAALGLPGGERVYDERCVERILGGEQFIDVIPMKLRRAMADKNVTRLVKESDGDARFETIDNVADVVKLAARGGAFDLVEEFGFPKERMAALDMATRLAIAAGIDALRDAGIPLVMRYKTTTTGSQLPDRWALPEEMRDDTGVIFASAFPGFDSFAQELNAYHEHRTRLERLGDLEDLRGRIVADNRRGDSVLAEVDRRIGDLRAEIERAPFKFDRRFLFRVLAMGHSQFAEYIGARGPNAQVNGACASTTQAASLAHGWIEQGRCRRVIVVSADNITSDNLMEWFGSGFLASGAAATDEVVEEAAVPFDRRRHGLIIGMGGAALVLESHDSAAERGITPICELLSSVALNSAFHGTRLDVDHICTVMEDLVSRAERDWGLNRQEMAPKTVFVSHETYTPARGGSAAAEVLALRRVFGTAADEIVIANTKGATGHPMGVGVEDTVAVKILETGIVPPVPNFKEVDPELGRLNLSRGGAYPVEFALRLAAGFGSQIGMTLSRRVPGPDGQRRRPDSLGYDYRIADRKTWNEWLARVSGHTAPELEVHKRTLRLRDEGLGARKEKAVTRPPVAAPAPEAPAPPEVRPTDVPPAREPSRPVQVPSAVDPVRERVLAIIAEKSGYPADMLEMDLDLEADLGIDTVKQAEMFAAIREAYDIPRDENLKLRDFPTLAHTVQFVYDHRPDLAGPAAAGPEATGAAGGAVPTDATPSPEPVGATDVASAEDPVKRRVPVAHLRPAIDLCKPTGVGLDGGSHAIVVTDNGGVGAALVSRLEKRGVAVMVVDDAPDAEEIEQRVAKWKSDGVLAGVFWLPALDDEGPLEQMDLASWREAIRVRVKLLYRTIRALGDSIGAPGSFLVSATRLGGRHGYDDAGALAPIGGAVTGFTKAFKRERPEALVKAVDFEASRKTAALADRLIDEALFDPGVVEVGYKDDLRWTVGLSETEAPTGDPVALDGDSVFVITGAAGSIVSAITADLASASGGTFHLLDLTPEPNRDDADIKRFETDREGLMRDVFERLKSQGGRATPAMVERELAGVERLHAALAAIEAVEKAGGTAHYHSVNLLDDAAVAAVMDRVRETSGRIDVLIHAAGVEISHMIGDKEPREFDLVFDVKCDGWFNVISNLGDMHPGRTVVFSSIAGRFGNAGQTDYSAANDLLCKHVSGLRNRMPSTRGIAIDWTAWGGIGMASRGSIPTIMKESGIDMLQPEAGISILRRELTAADAVGEVVVAGSLGKMLEEFDDTGGLDPAKWNGGAVEANGIMTGKVVGMGLHGGLIVETTLDPSEQPFLYDHQIGGTPVLPGVMGIEALVEAAKLLFPDRYIGAIEDVNFLIPFKFYRGEPRTVRARAFFRLEGDDVVAECRLEGSRTLHGQSQPEVTTHFRARVRLLPRPPKKEERRKLMVATEAKKIASEDIYRVYFHGPAYQVVENTWREGNELVGLYAGNLPANHAPAERMTVAEPRWIELCFQTAGIMELAGKARMGLPHRIGRLKILRTPEQAAGRVVAAVTSGTDESFDAQVVDEKGDVMMTVEGYRTMELPDAVEKKLLEPLKEAIDRP